MFKTLNCLANGFIRIRTWRFPETRISTCLRINKCLNVSLLPLNGIIQHENSGLTKYEYFGGRFDQCEPNWRHKETDF